MQEILMIMISPENTFILDQGVSVICNEYKSSLINMHAQNVRRL